MKIIVSVVKTYFQEEFIMNNYQNNSNQNSYKNTTSSQNSTNSTSNANNYQNKTQNANKEKNSTKDSNSQNYNKQLFVVEQKQDMKKSSKVFYFVNSFSSAVCPAKLDHTCRCKSGHGNRQ